MLDATGRLEVIVFSVSVVFEGIGRVVELDSFTVWRIDADSLLDGDLDGCSRFKKSSRADDKCSDKSSRESVVS